MREILFRGKRVDNGEWVYGQFTATMHARSFITPDNICQYDASILFVDDDRWCRGVKIDEQTVGQYTGLTDKNGKKIFEGDVIRAHYANVPPEKCETVEQVVFRNGRFSGMYTKGNIKTWAGSPDGIPHCQFDKSVYMDWCEVIGNIHDNPELMGGRNNDQNEPLRQT